LSRASYPFSGCRSDRFGPAAPFPGSPYRNQFLRKLDGRYFCVFSSSSALRATQVWLRTATQQLILQIGHLGFVVRQCAVPRFALLAVRWQRRCSRPQRRLRCSCCSGFPKHGKTSKSRLLTMSRRQIRSNRRNLNLVLAPRHSALLPGLTALRVFGLFCSQLQQNPPQFGFIFSHELRTFEHRFFMVLHCI
jgi:hypothetical protein